MASLDPPLRAGAERPRVPSSVADSRSSRLGRWLSAAPAAWIFLTSRVALSAVALLALAILGDSSNLERHRWDSPRLHELGPLVDVWARWDSDWYLRIAEHGYSWPSSTPAFFPLYPFLVGGLGRALGEHFVLAGALFSVAAGLAAFLVLFRLSELKIGRRGATWTAILLGVAPTTLFLGAVYAEALYLLLAVTTFFLAERGRLGAAGIAAGLAILTRPLGVALLPALALFAWRAERRGVAFTRALPAVVLPLAYPLLLWAWIGRPFAFVDAQGVVWGRHLSVGGPLGGVAAAAGSLRLVDLVVAVALTVGGVAAWRLLGPAYGTYVLACVAIPLTFAADGDPLLSIQRFALAAFPVFIVLAAWVSPHRARAAVAFAFAAWSAVLVVRWALWYWVA